MADFTTTTNLSLKKPAVGGSSDKWGEYLNSDLDTIDSEIQSLKTASTSRSLESLSNVLDTTPTTGQLLQYDTANWKAATVSIPDNIQDLTNVTVTSPSDGQVLAYSTSNSRWENQTPGAATIPDGTITTAKLSTALQGQVNLILQTTGTPTDDQILRYNSTTTNWEFQDLPGGTISALSDTDVSGISNQDVLVYNSTSGNWVSRPLAIADVTGLQATLDAKLESSDLSVSSLTDTTITTTADDSFLVYDSSDSKWKNEGPSTARSSLGLGALATQDTITESQISDLQSYITASSTDTLINKSGNISQWTNDSGYLTAETNDLSSAVTGTLPIANGGTGQTTAAAARIALLPALGTAGQVLAVNTGTTDVEWVNPASGGGAGTVTSVAISGSDGIEVDSGSPITTSGTIALGINTLNLSNHLGLGTAAFTASTNYATAAQGALADSAVQPGDNANTLGSGAATDGYVLTADGAGGAAWEAVSGGTASLPIDLLSSGASIRKSDGTTAVLSESGGEVTLENTSLGDTVLMPDNSNNVSTAPGIRFEADTDTGIGLASAGNLAVVTGGSERMRIDSSGNVGIGTSSPASVLDVKGTITTSTSQVVAANTQIGRIDFRANDASSGGTGNVGSIFVGSDAAYTSQGRPGYMSFYTTSGTSETQRMRIDSSGNIGAPSGTNIYNASDERLKQNITDLSGCLQKVLLMRGVSFNWIDEFCDAEADKTLYGLIAQELQIVDSNLVDSFSDNTITAGSVTVENPLRVNEKFIIPMLVESIKEQQSQIDALTARIEALEA